MKHEIKKLEKNQVEITVEVAAEELQPYLEKAAKKLSEHHKIKGFRPGKAPFDIVKQKLGEMTIYQEALEIIVQKTYFDIIKKENLETISQPEIDVEKLAPGNPIVYKAKVNLLPKTELPDYKTIKIKGKEIKVDEKEVENVIQNLRKMRAKETSVDREAQKGDKVEADFTVSQAGVVIENGAHKKYSIVLGENKMIPGFEDQIMGMKKNEEKEFKLKFPKEYYMKNLADKEGEFKVKLLSVYQVELPELNDQFVQGLGQFKTVEKFKQQVRKNIEDEAKMKEGQRLEIEILEKIIEKTKFEDIPDILIDSEVHKMVHELKDNIAQQGFKFDDYLSHLKKTPDQLKLDFVPQALKRVQTALISRQIAEDEKIEVRDDEIKKEIELTTKAYPNNPEVQKNLESEGFKNYVRNILINKKVIALLKEYCVE